MQALSRTMVIGLWALSGVSALASAAEPVSNTLTVQRIVLRNDGSEQKESAATARPGDVLEYTAQFLNAGASVAHGLSATLPIPVGVVFVPASVNSARVQVSIDGTTFAPMPLMRQVRDADGRVIEQPVPLAEYRFVRWAPADLAAHGSLSVSARVVLANNATATPTAR